MAIFMWSSLLKWYTEGIPYFLIPLRTYHSVTAIHILDTRGHTHRVNFTCAVYKKWFKTSLPGECQIENMELVRRGRIITDMLIDFTYIFQYMYT